MKMSGRTEDLRFAIGTLNVPNKKHDSSALGRDVRYLTVIKNTQKRFGKQNKLRLFIYNMNITVENVNYARHKPDKHYAGSDSDPNHSDQS
jgi:hypothetical protein